MENGSYPKEQVTYKGAYIGVATPFLKNGDINPAAIKFKEIKKNENRRSTLGDVEKTLDELATQEYLAE